VSLTKTNIADVKKGNDMLFIVTIMRRKKRVKKLRYFQCERKHCLSKCKAKELCLSHKPSGAVVRQTRPTVATGTVNNETKELGSSRGHLGNVT